MKCFKKNSDASIPGIDTESLMAIGNKNRDWCYDPNWNGLMPAYDRVEECSSSNRCGVGQGNCVSDTDCIEDLSRFQFDPDASNDLIPGIDMNSLLKIENFNYNRCYDPNWSGNMTDFYKFSDEIILEIDQINQSNYSSYSLIRNSGI